MGLYTWRNWREMPNIRALENIRSRVSYAIQSQYSASKTILALAAGFQERIDPRADLETFYTKCVDIYTAEGAGLDNWGSILTMGRVITDPDTGVSFSLDDEQYRLLLLYKALANISASDSATLNKLLSVLVDTGVGGFSGAAYVLEIGTMVIRWVFESFMDEVQLAVFKVAGQLARGGGVGWELYAVNPQQVFGFDGSGMHPFNQAPFAPDNILISKRS